MDAAQARIRLETMTAWDKDPVLTSAELDMLVSLARRADSDGFEIGDVGWTATYDLNAAAAIGWEWKAGKANDVDFESDGQSFKMAQLALKCERQADRYRRRTSHTITLTSGMTVVNTEV